MIGREMRQSLHILLLLIGVGLFRPVIAQTSSADPVPCQGDRKTTGEVFWLVCAGREAEARRIVDSRPTAQAMVFDLAAYAAANMERGNFAVGFAAAREMVNLERIIEAGGDAQQPGWSYRREPNWPWHGWAIRHPALQHALVPTWPLESPPTVYPPHPNPLPAGIWAIQESLLVHPHERIRMELSAWITFAFPTRPAMPRGFHRAIVGPASGRQRVAYYLALAGRDLDAVALLRPTSAATGDRSGGKTFAASIIDLFVAVDDPHRALAALRLAGVPFDPIGENGEWEVIHLLLRKDDVSSAMNLLPTQAQRRRYTWPLADAYLKRQDSASALRVLREGFVAARDYWLDESSHLHFAEVFARLGDGNRAQAALSAAEKAIPNLRPLWDDEDARRMMKATGASLLQFAIYQLRAEPFDQSFAALSDPVERLHFLALCINAAADKGDAQETSRLIRLIDGIQLPPQMRREAPSTYVGDEARYQAGLRFAARKDARTAQTLVNEIRHEGGRRFAVEDVARVLAWDPEKVDVRHYVLNARLVGY